MRWVIKSELAEIARLAGQVEGFGVNNNIEPCHISNINLALDELITNTISYGYDDNKEHEIIIDMRLAESEIVVQVQDDGKPFNPLDMPDPDLGLELDQRPAGGLGIYLVRTMMDQVEYERRGNQNIITMRKRLVDCQVKE
jgi:anti-sigma regulatory factor (Ser/Thr protein kinase)